MRPLVVLQDTGQGGDSPMFPEVMGSLRVPRRGKGRPRTKPDRAKPVRAMPRECICVKSAPEIASRSRHRGGDFQKNPTTSLSVNGVWCRRRPTSLVRQGGLPETQRDRTMLRATQTAASNRNPARQTRHYLPRKSRPADNHNLAQGLRRHALTVLRRLAPGCVPSSGVVSPVSSVASST